VEIGAVSFVTRAGGTPQSGWVVITVLAAASVIGGLLDAATSSTRFGGDRLRPFVLSLLMALGALVTALSSSLVGVLLGVIMLGACTAPLLSARSLRTEAVVSASERSRAFTLASAAQSLGFAAAGGLLTLMGPSGAVAAGGVLVALSGVVVLLADTRHRVAEGRGER
jgi:hypothetical protein